MTFYALDIFEFLRCDETDDEGFRCALRPNHDGEHAWLRCPLIDDTGAQCLLPPNHPGQHQRFWYDEPVPVGTVRTLDFEGTERDATSVAERAGGLAGRRGWVETRREYRLGLTWRLPGVAAFRRLFADPEGTMSVTFERRELRGGE